MRLKHKATAMRLNPEFSREKLTEPASKNFNSWANKSYKVGQGEEWVTDDCAGVLSTSGGADATYRQGFATDASCGRSYTYVYFAKLAVRNPRSETL